jgi:glycosyltransferase involved in cell wall biosynthesis
MKISILLPNLCGGGAENVRLILANELAKRGHEIDFIILRGYGESMDDVSLRHSLTILNCNKLRQSLLPLRKYIKEQKPHVLLVGMWPLTLIGAIATLCNTKCKLILSEHTDLREAEFITSFQKFILANFGKFIYQKANAVVAVSDGVADSLSEMARLKKDNITIIHNPAVTNNNQCSQNIDPWHISEWKKASKKLIAIGNFKHAKRFDILLHAFARVSKREDFKLLLLGDGTLRQYYIDLCRRLKISGKVFMPGYIKNVSYPLRTADLLVVSSDREGFPNVILDALSVGTPVVSTDCRSGPGEILDNGKFGVLVRCSDVESLSEGISISLRNGFSARDLKGRAEFFSVEKTVNSYLKIINQ